MERRALLFGAPLALVTWGLSSAGAAAAASEAERVLADGALARERARRRLGERLVQTPLPEPVLEGFAALAVVEGLLDASVEAQAHPRVQAMARGALRDLGRGLRRVRRALARAPELPLKRVLEGLDGLEQELRAEREGCRAERACSGVRRLRAELGQRGVRASARGMARRLERAEDLSRRVTDTGTYAVLESEDPALVAALRGARPARPPRARPSLEVVLAGLVAGVLVVMGLFLFGFGAINSTECLCAAIPVMLLGVVVLVAGGMLMQWAQHRYAEEQQALPSPPVPVPTQPGTPEPPPPDP